MDAHIDVHIVARNSLITKLDFCKNSVKSIKWQDFKLVSQ